MSIERPEYGVDETLRGAVKQLATGPNGSCTELDQTIQKVGPHHVAHFLTTAADPSTAEILRLYLSQYWPAYLELIDQLIRAARRSPENEDLKSDFGQS